MVNFHFRIGKARECAEMDAGFEPFKLRVKILHLAQVQRRPHPDAVSETGKDIGKRVDAHAAQ